jgi:hypothetical protein
MSDEAPIAVSLKVPRRFEKVAGESNHAVTTNTANAV